MDDINYTLIIVSALVAIASPGPATLAIAGASMGQGRTHGLALAAGVFTGSLFWSLSAAFGLAALLYTNAWLFEMMRYVGAIYLLYLAFRSVRSMLSGTVLMVSEQQSSTLKSTYFRGLFIHLTNPKAIFFFASLYSVGVPNNVTPQELLPVISLVAAVAASVFFGYSVLFSNAVARKVYLGSRRIFEAVFAVLFGIAGARLLAAELSSGN